MRKLKRKLTLADYLLIIVNLVPVYGVWFEGWNAAQVFLVYCMETVIIGLFTVIKLACITLFIRPRDEWQSGTMPVMASGLFFILFFIVHYGIFVFVQTQIFFSVSGLVKDSSTFGIYRQIPEALGHEGRLLLIIFVLYYTLQNLLGFFLSGEYKTASMMKIMFQPYGRIIVQQFVVIIGSMILAFGGGKVFILILALVKIYAEVFFNFDRIINITEAKQKLKESGLEEQKFIDIFKRDPEEQMFKKETAPEEKNAASDSSEEIQFIEFDEEDQ